MSKKKIVYAFTGFLVVVLAIMLYALASQPITEPVGVTYEEFKQMVLADRVKEVSLNFSSETFQFQCEGDEAVYETDNPRYENFKKDLLDLGIEVREEKESKIGAVLTSLATPMIVLIAFAFMMKSSLSAGEKVGVTYDSKEKVTFKNVAGLKEVKEDLRCVTDFLANPEKYKKAGAKLPKGVLLYGPPGTGKTLLARAVAGEANANFISVSGSDFSNKFVGVGADRVRQLFKEAREKKPCIIFIDEIDAVGSSRDGHAGHSENRNTLNALLTQMDGFNSGDGVLVIAATNRLEDLDSALVRPGRFDNMFAVPLPTTTEERREVIDIYAQHKKFAESVDLNSFAKQMIGKSPADIQAVMNEASIIGARDYNGVITKEALDEAYLKKILNGHVKTNADRDIEQLRLTAWHEAGHALIGSLLGQEATKVTILPSSSGAGGFTIFSPPKMGMFSKKELENRVRTLYAGRAAEELLVGKDDITTGASNDIERATTIIDQIVSKFGMCDGNDGPTILDYTQIRGSDTFVMNKMNELAAKYYQETVQMLQDNKDKLDRLATELLEKESLSEKEILAIIQ